MTADLGDLCATSKQFVAMIRESGFGACAITEGTFRARQVDAYYRRDLLLSVSLIVSLLSVCPRFRALDRRIPANVADLKARRWNKAEYSKARGLFGRTLGLVGLGRIGQEVLSRAHAFGMPVIAWSPSLTPKRAESLGVQMKQSPT